MPAPAPAPAARATLDWFDAQANARRRTVWLVASFAAALCVVVALVYVALLVVAGATAEPGAAAGAAWVQPGLLVAAAAGVAAVTGVGSAYHALRLSAGGGDAVAELLGGTLVDRGTSDPALRRLVNVAEEMAIASGLPVPHLYVLEREPSLNAFAAGYTPGHGAIAVTRGAVDALSRDELQGVVAHEFSHLLNGDTRIDLRLMTAVGGLTFLALIGRLVLQYGPGPRSRDDRGRSGLVLVGLALLVAGAFGAFCGKLVRYAVARQREWLADAASVQFTRNPDGLAGALRKIASQGSAISSPHAPEAAHLFLARSSEGFWAGLFSTHPPIEERIRRLAPYHVPPAASTGSAPVRPSAPAPGVAAAAGVTAAPAAAPAAAPVAAARVALRPDADHVDVAAARLEGLPAALTAATREPFGARALACGLLLAPGAADRELQLAWLATRDGALGAEVRRLAPALGAAPRPERLALLALAVPALDALSPAQGAALAEELAALAAGDGVTTPFEWAVQRVATRRLRRGPGAPVEGLRTVGDAGPECLDVLSTLAWLGSRDAGDAQAALDAGARALGVSASWRLLPRDRIGPARVDAALARLDGAAPSVKARLLAACVAAARADARVTVEEAEVVRAVAAALGLPMPPLLAGAAPAA